MRASFRPLAGLVDAAAGKWLAAEGAQEDERALVRDEIIQAFRIGDNPELTFHGLRSLLRISRQSQRFLIEVHEIAMHD